MRHEEGCYAHIKTERLQQYGFCASAFGRSVKTLTLAFCWWLQISIVLTIVSNYNGVWLYAPLAEGIVGVTWDSYTRAFLLPWLGIAAILFTARRFRQRLKTFYMAPCALVDATVVRIMVDVADEAGNLVRTDEVCRVQRNDAGDRLVALNLLTYVFCPASEAFTAEPKGRGGVPREEAERTRVRQTFTGAWAHAALRAPGLSRDAARGALQGAQGRNEVLIHVPSIWEARRPAPVCPPPPRPRGAGARGP